MELYDIETAASGKNLFRRAAFILPVLFVIVHF